MRRFTLMAVMLLMTLCFQSSPAWSNRLVDLDDGTVVDTVSSLRWLKNANCTDPAGGIVKATGYLVWDNAQTWSNNLTTGLCGLSDGSAVGDWHLPTIDELRIFTDADWRYYTLNAFGFTNVQANYYWSSSTDAYDAGYALVVDMSSGDVGSGSKTYNHYVWPVRAGQFWSLGSLVVLGAVDFGSLPVGSVLPGHQFTLKNRGTTTQSVTSMALGGGNPTLFALATGGSSPCSSLTPTLAAGASCTVMVSAKTTTLGSNSANLTITTTDGSANIPLTATILPLTVTYNGNGNSSGSVPSDTTAYAFNAAVTVLDNSGALAKTGYAFNGWNTTADGSGTSYQTGATFVVATPVILYAVWAAPIAPPSGLVSWWRGEGGGIDAAGGLDGIATSSMAYAAGKVGQAFSLNGSTASIAVPDNAKLNFGTHEFSIAAWIKTTDTRIWQRLVTKRDPTGYNYWYSLVLNSGKVTFEVAGSGTNVSSTVSVADGMWHHIAVTRDPATVSPRKYHLYIDGIENVTLADSGLNLDNTAPLEIGKFSTESYGGIYSGLIDEIQLFNRGLTAAEIKSIYNAGSAGLAPVPAVTVISPSSGPATGNTQVVITGTNLASAIAVKFGNNAATGFTVNSDTQITAVSPFSSSGTVDVTVTILGGTSATSSADQFIYTMVDQAITFGTAPTIAVGGNGVVSATVSSGLAVTFSSQTPAICSISNTTVTGAAQGGCIIKASQAGNATYNPVEQTQSFTITAAVAATATTTAATAITISGATLNATVNANYSSALVSFEYGSTTAYGSTTTASPSPVSGGTPTSITAVITALTSASIYHFRVKAVNTVTGTVYGEDRTFTTLLPRFVDLNDGTMLDTNNSLRWLQNANCTDAAGGIAKADGYLFWTDAQTWSSSLASPTCALSDGSKAGDWHLPTIDELQTPVAAPDNYRYDTLNAAGFSNVQANYWSSSTYVFDTFPCAWYVDMGGGFVNYTLRGASLYVWPVRGGQYWSLGPLIVLGTVDFGSQSIGSAASGHQFIVKNTAATAQPVSGIALNGTDANQFSVATGGSAPCATLTPNLAAGASCTVMVSAAPTSSGAKTANLTVTTATGSTAIPLTVTAIYSVPAISAVSPSSGFASGGTSVTISGSGLTGATAVKFTATDATSFFVGSDSQLTAASPAGVVGQIADITVTTPGGASATSSADQFSYTLQYQAKNQSTGSSYATLAEAIANASAGNEVWAYAGQFDGAFSLARDIILNGGYNVDFNAKDSLPTTLNGSLTVNGGAAKVDSVTVKGILSIKSGSLQVNGVVVQ